MRRFLFALSAVIVFSSTGALADDRTLIVVPDDVRPLFLEEMRTHLDNLNEITYALASGDFKGAAYVAANKMTFGHSVREVMKEQGKSEVEINAFIEKMRAKQQNGDHPGRGMGRYMPPEVRMLGQEFHGAAQKLADAASAVQDPPSLQDYKNVFSALSEVIDVCSACHSSYRIK